VARTFLSYAKINLYLAVRGLRPDGYHEIDTAMQTVSLADRMIFESTPDGGLEIECDAPGVPSGPANLAGRALKLLQRRLRVGAGMRLRVVKTIPVQAGLGGGSSNAACALGAANSIWGLGLDAGALEALAAEIGSDVPFFIRGGTQRCRGRGELLEPLAPLPDSLWAILRPPWGLATADVYRGFTSGLIYDEVCTNMALGQIAKQDLAGVVRTRFDDLESAAQRVRPEAAEVRSFLVSSGLSGVTLAGSGSAWIGFCPGLEVGERVRAEAAARGWLAFLVRPVRGGWLETVK
jgi:4-diphosphocytidyl-2-C-methyl-D-erythritol kinase